MPLKFSLRTTVAINAISAIMIGLFLAVAPGTAADVVGVDTSGWLRLLGVFVLCIGAALAVIVTRLSSTD